MDNHFNLNGSPKDETKNGFRLTIIHEDILIFTPDTKPVNTANEVVQVAGLILAKILRLERKEIINISLPLR